MLVSSTSQAACRRMLTMLLIVTGAATVLPSPVLAQAPYLTLFETVAEDTKFWAGNWKVSDGAASNDAYGEGSYVSQHTWSSPPAQMDASGFTISMQVTASTKSECAPFFTGTSIGGTSFEYSLRADPLGFGVNLEPPPNCDASKPGQTRSNGGSIVVKPLAHLGDGQIAEFKAGGFYGPAIIYRYRVSTTPPEGGASAGTGTSTGHSDDLLLAAHLECAPTIIISELPSLNCHIVITSWNRDTAAPVEVILPDALDFYGNHPNGIQLLQAAGEQDLFNWSAPYYWGMFVFACPSQSGTGANCFGSVTTPGPQSVAIIVRQGDLEVPLQLNITAIPRPGGQGQSGGQGQGGGQSQAGGQGQTGGQGSGGQGQGSSQGLGTSICGFAVGQAIFDKWTQAGGQTGALGCASGPEQDTMRSTLGTDSRGVPFEGGAVVVHTTGPRAGTAFALHGSIGSLYISMGGTGSWLGLPLTDEYDIAGGRRTDFENGYIAWDRLTGGSIAMRDGSGSMTFEPNTNRGGSDILNFPVIDDRAEMCRDACAGNSSCVAYTYVKPGWQGERAMCWLKSALPAAETHECCDSGVKR